MASRSIYLTDDELEEMKEMKINVQEIFRQGWIIETLLQGTNPKLNNEFNKNKIKKLIQFHQQQIEGLHRTIDYHKEQINKLKGGETNATISNKETKDN
jgi:predicted transcriptional regulator